MKAVFKRYCSVGDQRECILIIGETNDRLPYSLVTVFMHSGSVTGSYTSRNPLNIKQLLVSALSLSGKGLVKHKSGHKVWRATEKSF